MAAAPNFGLDADSGPFVPAAYLPSQVPRSDPECGEHRLLRAVLADAFNDLKRPPRRSDATLAWFTAP
jgi:hypothetical protein